MLNRDDLLRIARITEYNRYFTPSKEQMNDPSFEYEHVQFSIHKPLDTGGYCIKYQQWKKAQKGSAFDPYMTDTEMTKKIQHAEVRALEPMNTSELRKLLETSPLKFKFEAVGFPTGLNVVVLPKLTPADPHEVYLQWSKNRNLYVEQRSIDWQDSELHNAWFNNEKPNTNLGHDWRYLLKLNWPDITPTNELYKIFGGIYTDEIEFRLKKGTEIYRKERAGTEKKSDVETPTLEEVKVTKELKTRITSKLHTGPEGQKMVCIKPPKGDIIRIQQYYTGKFIKNGWVFASKEEYKEQENLKFKKRKEMAEDNVQEQMQKYKGPKSSNRGQAGTPYLKTQLIKVWPRDKNKKKIETETIQVKLIIPEFEYIPKFYLIRQNGIEILKEPLVDRHGNQLFDRKKIGQREEWITIERKVKPTIKTIKVLQIPSKKSQSLKRIIASEPVSTDKDGRPILPVVKYFSKKEREEFIALEEGDPNRFKVPAVKEGYEIITNNYGKTRIRLKVAE